MARVTVEDCILSVPDRFELVVLASQRTRDINSGASPMVPRDGDKNAVISLREIAKGSISVSTLRKGLLANFQRHLGGEDEPVVESEELLDEQEKVGVERNLSEQEAQEAGFSEEDLSEQESTFESDNMY